MPVKLAIVASHPIQYFAPWYRELAKLAEVDLRVFFCCDWGVSEYFDPQLGVKIKWDIPLLEGYAHEFLPIAKRPERLGFREVDNPAVGATLARFNPDAVKIYGYARRTNWRVARWARKNRKPLLMMTDSNANMRTAAWKRVAKELVVRSFYRRVDGALYISENNYNYHTHFGLPPERLFRSTFPIDRSRLLAQVGADARARVRQQRGIPPDAFVALLCGKYVAHKRPLDLAAAGHAAAQSGANVWTLLVGEGPERAALERFIKTEGVKNCVLTGFVNQSAISEYYAAADALVLPSSMEAYSLVVSEAISFGLPVIVSDQVGCVGPQDTARPGVNAIVFPCGDLEQLREAMVLLCQNRALCAKMARASEEISLAQDVTVAAQALSSAAHQLVKLGPR
jgi:glycosyltransferase involved in cell wall biosynthesis